MITAALCKHARIIVSQNDAPSTKKSVGERCALNLLGIRKGRQLLSVRFRTGAEEQAQQSRQKDGQQS